MTDIQMIASVRQYLLSKEQDLHVYLTIPPNAKYPLILVELEEIWSTYPLHHQRKRGDVQSRIKFKINIFSQRPGIEEAAQLSHRVRNYLEGASLEVPIETGKSMISILRFLACISESTGSEGYRVIRQFYDCLVRG